MIHILIRYLGIKTKLLDDIKKEVKNVAKEGSTILDLFAGSTIVGQSLATDYKIISNDIQKYSTIVGKAVLCNKDNIDYSSLQFEKDIINSKFYNENLQYLLTEYKELFEYEKNLMLQLISNPNDLLLLNEFKKFYEEAPYPDNYEPTKVSKIYKKYKEKYSKKYYNDIKKSGKYELFTLAYAQPYFSICQSIHIDSLKCAIENEYGLGNITETKYNVYTSLLLFALQNIVTSVGDHFAQPQQFKLENEHKFKKEIKKILSKKTLDINELILSKEIEFKSHTKYKFSNEVYNMDFRDLFEDNKVDIFNKIDVLYIDPPYTNAHYSRFYHILETLVAYDYPTIKFKGRYREDRFQSNFCLKKEALQEFSYLVQKCNENKKSMIISYSDTSQCIISKTELISTCQKFYTKVEIKEISYTYKNLGQKPNATKSNELLIICEV